MATSPRPNWKVLALLLGLYLTARGYRSYEGDQAYRLPLLLDRLDPTLYADDAFVRAFDAFNPHVGYLTLLELPARLLGLDLTLFALWAAAFVAMALGVRRLADTESAPPYACETAVGLLLLARAGNIGTNHLFEPLLLDRLLVLGLGWLALARSVAVPNCRLWVAAAYLGAGALIHPSLGFLLIGLLGSTWIAWALLPTAGRVPARVAARAVVVLALAAVPAFLLHGSNRAVLLHGLPLDEFRLLSFQIQSPQHLIPHLWRMPQWLAFACYPVLAALAWRLEPARSDPRRQRLTILLGVNLGLLACAWFAIEILSNTTVTVLQPFRLATVARGLCLAMSAGHVARLWSDQGPVSRFRAVLLAAGLCSDWALVVATATEITFAATASRNRRPILPLAVLTAGMFFIVLNDPERGYIPLFAVATAGLLAARVLRRLDQWGLPPRRPTMRVGLAFAWIVPLAALVASELPPSGPTAAIQQALIDRCRFTRTPTNDIEKLAAWSRDHTPTTARFIGPPGPKSFRLWSERPLAFNRAASPYHAAGLADWAARFKQHTRFNGSTADFARSYSRDRHALESRFAALSPAELASLARSQKADHLLTGQLPGAGGPEWEPLRTEGRYTVYRLREPGLARVNLPNRSAPR